ncbi:MAG: hypothetical protein RJA76_2241 [Bacteroidota bacterium]
MFVTIFHSILLIIQLFISDSSSVYNQKLINIKFALRFKKFDSAKKSLMELESKNIFNNYQIHNQIKLIDLKSNKGYFDNELVKNKVLQALLLFENGKKNNSLEYLKSDISKFQSDTLVAWYEIIASRQKISNNSKISFASNETKQFDTNEALDLLNLMKNKEKYIKYE